MFITLILGTAGTGKSRMVAKKYAELLEQGYTSKDIIVISYSKYQVRNTAKKIKAYTKINLKQIDAHTLHSYSKHAVNKDAKVFHEGYWKEMSEYLGVNMERVERGVAYMKNTMSKNDAVGANKAGLDVKSFQKQKLFYNTVKENMPGTKEWHDFSDMIERAILQGKTSKAKILIAEECQDFSALHWKAIYIAFQNVEHAYFTADPYQSLYRFQGAKPDYIEQMRADEIIILTEQHRCCKEVTQMAELIARQIGNKYIIPNGVNMKKDNFAVFYPDNNIFPLFQAVNYSRRHGYKVMILANTFRQLHLTKIKLLGPYSQTYPSHFISGKLKEFYRGEEKNPLVFSTVHQAKGLEADIVIYNSSCGRTDEWSDYGTKEDRWQDYWRMVFTAITRAKRGLIVCQLSNPIAGEPNCLDVLYYAKFGYENYLKWFRKKGNTKHLIPNTSPSNMQ